VVLLRDGHNFGEGMAEIVATGKAQSPSSEHVEVSSGVQMHAEEGKRSQGLHANGKYD